MAEAYHAVTGVVRRIAKLGKSMRILPAQGPPTAAQTLAQGKKVAERMWLPDLQVETIDVNASQLQQVARQLSSSLGGECRMIGPLHMAAPMGRTSHLVGFAKEDYLIAMFEVEDKMDGVLFRRVCDHPVRELLRLEALPDNSEWPKKYEPVNSYGGSRKLPSRASAADLIEA